MKGIFIFLLCLSLLGCADTKYLKRLDEIETAYKNGEITKAEYLHLKNEADQVHETRRVKAAIISSGSR